MKTLANGMSTAIVEITMAVTVGMIPGILIHALKDSLPLWFVLLFPLVAVIAEILEVGRMLKWKILFTFGWLIGAFILLDAGLLGLWQFVLWIVCPVVVLVWRAAKAVDGGLN
jgi:hypothetical protein